MRISSEGGESVKTREAKAINLLHAVLSASRNGLGVAPYMKGILNEIEAFLADIEAENRR